MTPEMQELSRAYHAYKKRQYVVKEVISEILPYEEIVSWRKTHDRIIRAIHFALAKAKASDTNKKYK